MTSVASKNGCIIHYESVCDSNKLISLRDVDSWKYLYRAAEIRNYEPILSKVNSEDEGFSELYITYHTTCRSLFTMKRDLDKILNSTKKNSEASRENSRKTNKL